MSYKYNLHTQDGLLYYYPGVERENKCPIVVLLDAIEVNNNMLKTDVILMAKVVYQCSPSEEKSYVCYFALSY